MKFVLLSKLKDLDLYSELASIKDFVTQNCDIEAISLRSTIKTETDKCLRSLSYPYSVVKCEGSL